MGSVAQLPSLPSRGFDACSTKSESVESERVATQAGKGLQLARQRPARAMASTDETPKKRRVRCSGSLTAAPRGRCGRPKTGSRGRAVAVSYDGQSIVVGGQGESSAATGVNKTTPGQDDTSIAYSGAAYAFALVSGQWTQVAYLKAARAYGMNFGIATAVSNGGLTIAVGGVSEPSNDVGVDGTNVNTSALGSGVVYTFK